MSDDVQKKQPTILVKKADGTSVRVTIAQFKEMRNENSDDVRNTPARDSTELAEDRIGGKQYENTKVEQKAENNDISVQSHDSTTAQQHKSSVDSHIRKSALSVDSSVNSVDSSVQKPVDDLPQVATPHELATTTPVKDYFEDLAAAQIHASDFDHSSLLEEDLSEVKEFEKQGARHVTQADISKHEQAAHKHADTDDDAPRLASLIASWKKGIRSDEQFIAHATKNRAQGGIGLEQHKAQILLDELKKDHTHGAGVAEKVPGKRVSDTPTLQLQPEMQMEKPTEQKPAQQPTVPVNFSAQAEEPYKIEPTQKRDHAMPKGVMADVSHEHSHKTMGPEEEIARFGLEDFRRLSKDATKAGEMLYAKFDNWRQDDYLLYMKAVDRWHESPLFRMYVDVAHSALTNKKPVSDVLKANGRLSTEEYEALIEVNKKLAS